MNKKTIPYIIGLPNLGVGLLWAMNLSLIPMLVQKVTDSNFKLALLISMGAFSGIFIQYIAGLLSDRCTWKMGKRKPFIILGSLAACITMCVMPYMSTYILMFITAVIFYVTLNFYQGPYYSLIPEVVENSRLGFANGFSKVISVLGSAFIFVMGPKLWEKNIAYPFYAGAAVSLIFILGAIIFIKEDTSKTEKPQKISFDFIKFPSVVRLYVSVFLIFMAYGCITPFFVKYCTGYLKMTSGAASTGLLVLTLVGAAVAPFIGILADKIQRKSVLGISVLLFSLCLFAGILLRDVVSIYVMLGMIGIGFIGIQVTSYTILAEIVPPERLGEFMGIFNFFVSFGQFFANLVMGYMLDKLGFGIYFPTAAILMFSAAIVIFFSKFEKYKP